jgi:hypothetical protein
VKKIDIEKLHNLYLSPNVVMVIKSRQKIWVGHAARKGEVRKNFSRKNLRGLLADLGVILRLFSRKADVQLDEVVSGGIL